MDLRIHHNRKDCQEGKRRFALTAAQKQSSAKPKGPRTKHFMKGSGDKSPADSKGSAFGRRRPSRARHQAAKGEPPSPAPHLDGTHGPCGAAFLPDARAHASEGARSNPRASPSFSRKSKGAVPLFSRDSSQTMGLAFAGGRSAIPARPAAVSPLHTLGAGPEPFTRPRV